MGFLNIFLYFVLPLAIVVYFYMKKKYSYFEEQGIPHIKPSWIMGNLDGIGSKIHIFDFFGQLYKECKGKDVIAGFYTSVVPSLVVNDLELVKHITVKDFNIFIDRGVFVNEEDEPLTGNLFSIEGEKWRFIRNKLSPVFTSGKIKSMFHTISSKGNAFVEVLTKASKSGSVDVKEMSNRFNIDVTSSTAFGMESHTLLGQNDEMIQIFKLLFGEMGVSILRFMFTAAFPKFSKFIHLKIFNKTVTDFFNGVISESVAQRENSKTERNDFLNMLIQLKNKGSIDGEFSTESRKLTLDEITAQAFIFFLGGADTSSTAAAFAICELGKHTEIQEKLREEVIEKTKNTDGEITYENLHEMTFLTQVMNETLRMYPPAGATIRQASEDYKIPNSKHVIKKGTQLFINNLGFHYDEEYWKNPNEFNPDRFSPEESANRPNLAFMPFGEGPRNCIGMRFAQVNVKFVIATAVKNFKISLDTTKTNYPFKFDPKTVGLAPVGGFWANFEKLEA